MINEGKVVELQAGTPVYVMHADFMGLIQVRVKGTTAQVWVQSDSVSN